MLLWRPRGLSHCTLLGWRWSWSQGEGERLPVFSSLAKSSSPGICSQKAEEIHSPARRKHPLLAKAKCASRHRELFIGSSVILTRPCHNWKTAPPKDSFRDSGVSVSPPLVSLQMTPHHLLWTPRANQEVTDAQGPGSPERNLKP